MKVETSLSSTSWIDPAAYNIVDRLQKNGFETYLVGGSIRDWLAGIPPKDFDIATNALPEQVRRKIPQSYVIGRRFKLVLVRRGDQQYEVATFRRSSTTEDLEAENPILGDNFFGTCEDDAFRRDFTLNSLFADPIKKRIIDYCGGLEDIKNCIVRVIGDPETRFREDSIRMLRALRLAHKLSFSLEEKLRAAIPVCAEELTKSALPRRREEYLKILKLHDGHLVWREMHDCGILKYTVPALEEIYLDEEKASIFEFHLIRLFENYKPETPAEYFSMLMFSYLQAAYLEKMPSTEKIEQDEKFIAFIKDQLGVFKLEFAYFLKVLQVKNSMSRIELYIRRGERRQRASMAHEHWPLAINLARIDQSFSFRDICFWHTEFLRFNSQLRIPAAPGL